MALDSQILRTNPQGVNQSIGIECPFHEDHEEKLIGIAGSRDQMRLLRLKTEEGNMISHRRGERGFSE